MGSWNATCGISHLPIKSGQKVKTYILVPHWYSVHGNTSTYSNPHEIDKFQGSGLCYPYEAYSPLSLPIHGKYNDYGGMEDCKSDMNSQAILAFVNQQLSKSYLSVEEMISEISQGETPFSMMMVIDSIYDATVMAVEAATDEEYDSHRLMANVLQDFELAQEYLRTECSRESLMSALNKLDIQGADDTMQPFRFHYGRSWPLRDGANRTTVESFASFSLRDGVIDNSFSREHFENMLKSRNAPMEDLVYHYLFCVFMGHARRTWIAQCGAGSQADEYRMHRIVAEATIAHIQEQKKEHAAEINMNLPDEAAYLEKQY